MTKSKKILIDKRDLRALLNMIEILYVEKLRDLDLIETRPPYEKMLTKEWLRASRKLDRSKRTMERTRTKWLPYVQALREQYLSEKAKK